MEVIYLAGGCFWGVQAYFDKLECVIQSEVGYANSNIPNPSYEDVCRHRSSASECVKLTHTNLLLVLRYFFKIIDPFTLNKQGNDKGSQYRTGIYSTNEETLVRIKDIVASFQASYSRPFRVEILPLENFYKAEEYHQKYLEKNPTGYCHINLDDTSL
ncbi:peptide-methionine (S)-S-oxide reductase MsrA [Helicobacter sp. 11S02629-2]|uniref:peptide-methionine (S)-S-oxide reductase MsrA n=1 Tax=Helicobacter sp. 11S02629-2 TaxID=1476195 RepID=UPI000BA6842B|nr:peptide-methionine (S)-S-oxide reductase MsrA [Helicobacter sp. 11S02629-2]PAF42531.1 peptide-methionine (S)-S-oxide reductase [Helicobacter sp. 11S02629-2]